jgi:hypothetical protein
MKDSRLNPEIVSDIKRVVIKLGCHELSRREYIRHSGRFSVYQIYDDGRTWEEYCTAAGVNTKRTEPVPDEVYFERLKEAVKLLGRHPKTSERKRFGLNFSKRRYPTLQAFIEKAINLGIIVPDVVPTLEPQSAEVKAHLTSTTELTHKPVVVQAQKEHHRPVPPIPDKSKRNK